MIYGVKSRLFSHFCRLSGGGKSAKKGGKDAEKVRKEAPVLSVFKALRGKSQKKIPEAPDDPPTAKALADAHISNARGASLPQLLAGEGGRRSRPDGVWAAC